MSQRTERTELSGAATVRSNVDKAPRVVEREARRKWWGWFAAGTGVQGPKWYVSMRAKGSRAHASTRLTRRTSVLQESYNRTSFTLLPVGTYALLTIDTLK